MMYMRKGTVNGFRFTESLLMNLTPGDTRPVPAVVPLSTGVYYACHPRTAKRVAKQRGAFGFWRIKARKGVAK